MKSVLRDRGVDLGFGVLTKCFSIDVTETCPRGIFFSLGVSTELGLWLFDHLRLSRTPWRWRQEQSVSLPGG